MGGDFLARQLLGQVFEVMLPLLSLGGDIIGDDNRVLFDAQVPFPAAEPSAGEVGGVPVPVGLGQALAQLLNQRLGDQGQGHLAQTDIKIEGAGAPPTQVLIVAEELFDVPAVGEVTGEGGDLLARGGSAGKGFEMIGL